MSHRPPQHPANMDMFGFGNPVGPAIDQMQANQPPGSQGQDDAMMSLLDETMFTNFDPSSMNLSLDGDGVVMPPPPLPQLDAFRQHGGTLGPAPAASAPGPVTAPPAPPASGVAAPHQAVAMLQDPSTGTTVEEQNHNFKLGGSTDEITTPPDVMRTGAPPHSALHPQTKLFGSSTQPPSSTSAALFPPALPGSTLTEFTKKRDWAAKTVSELADLQQILDSNGRIKYVSPSVTTLTGWARDDVVDVFLRDLIHPDDVGVFVAELNEAIASGKAMRVFYRLRKRDGSYGIFESVGHGHIAAAKFAPNPHNQSQFCQAVFLMSRPYPTRNAALLDSFLEHKMENERLSRRIAELRREEEEEEDRLVYGNSHNETRSEITASEDTPRSIATGHHPPHLGHHHHLHGRTPQDDSMPPPGGRPGAINPALTRENLDLSIAGSNQDSISDKMARYEGLTSHDTIEMLTGLRYMEGERYGDGEGGRGSSSARGPAAAVAAAASTGSSSPMLVRGDAGIAITVNPDRDARANDKKKKLKVAEEYVCTDCGTLDSPEWRKGPSGPKTLCNACGLRWAKREKKRNAKSAKSGGMTMAGGGGGGNTSGNTAASFADR